MEAINFTDKQFWQSHHIVAKRSHYDDRMQIITQGKSYHIDDIFNDMIVFNDDLGGSCYLRKDTTLIMFKIAPNQ